MLARAILILVVYRLTVSLAACQDTVSNQSMLASLQDLRPQLSQIQSFIAEGTITVENSEAFVNAKVFSAETYKAEKVKHFSFKEIAQGSNLRLELSDLSEQGVALSKTVYFVKGKSFTAMHYDTGIASITNTGVANVARGINDRCPMLLEWSFLDSRSGEYGLAPITPTSLQDTSTWKQIIAELSLPSNRVASDLVLKVAEGKFDVQYSEIANLKKLLPTHITIFDTNGAPTTDLSISNYALLPSGMPLARDFVQNTYLAFSSVGKNIFAAKWTYHISSAQINVAIPGDEFDFDPAEARTIWDADHKVDIQIPK